jgi:tetratricopeptide (TPR) repeat protein
MRKIFSLLLLPLLALQYSAAQYLPIDSFKQELAKPQDDKQKLLLYSQLTLAYILKDKQDSSTYFATKALELAQTLKAPLEEASALSFLGYNLLVQQDYPRALARLQRSLEILENPKSEKGYFPPPYREFMRLEKHFTLQEIRQTIRARTFMFMGSLYNSIDKQKSLSYYWQARKTSFDNKDTINFANLLSNIGGRIELNSKKNIDSALWYIQQALYYNQKRPSRNTGSMYRRLASIYLETGDYPLALDYLHKALEENSKIGSSQTIAADYLAFANYYNQTRQQLAFC